MLKFATAQIIAAQLGDQQRVFKAAHRAVFTYDARPGYLYVRSRAISSRCNDNWDEFPAEEIAKAYRTFVGKPVFVNHVNDNHRRSRGVIIDAALHEDHNPDGSPDTWVEVLMEVDAKTFPKLAQAILDKHVDRTSMGCDVARSVCSACGNVATTPAEYCAHIPRLKGQRIYRHTASGRRVGELVRETCYGLHFFENSILVEPPADPTAHFLGVDASGIGKSASKTAAHAYSWDEIGQMHPHVYGEESGDSEGILSAASHIAHDREDDPDAEGSDMHDLRFHFKRVKPSQIDHQRHKSYDDRVQHAAQGYRNSPDQVPPLVLVHRHGVYQVADGHHRAAGAKAAGVSSVPAYVAYSPHENEPFSDGSTAPFHGSAKSPATPPGRKPQNYSGPGFEQQTLFASRSTTANPGIQTQAAGPVHPNPADHPWFQQVPLHHDHILAHWDKATPEEKAQGARWYPDAHHVAKAIAKLDPKITDDKEAAHKGAGVLSAYSPQQNWWANQHNAARSFVNGKAVGKGEGLMVMSSHANAAQRIMDGEDHQKVLKGPKTADFAHLIEHGGNDEKGRPSSKVVVDRHALSVAAGRRLTADDAAGFPTGSRHYYEHAANQYRTAAAIASDREGRHIPPHEMQATTWLVRQRLNADEDEGSRGGRGRQTVQRNQKSQWQELSKEHTPGLHEPPANSHVSRLVDASAIGEDGMIRLAYGEMKAPADVDTLREENCPVCGDADTYDGQICQVCGFISPPQEFRDPDLDMAKRMDLRKDVVDPEMVDDNGQLVRTQDVGNPMPQDGDQVGEDGQVIDEQQIGPDGQPMDPQANGLEESPLGDQALDGTQHGPSASDRNGDGIIQPDEIDADGNPNVMPLDPEDGGQAAPRELPWRAQDHTGEPFTKGPDMPDGPEEPEGPFDELEGPGAEEQQLQQASEPGTPGTPGDGVPDIACPNCGFATDTTPPQTQTMDNPAAAGDGIVAGDVCPNCQKAQLLSPAELQGRDAAPPPALPREPRL